jgi:nucleoid DNA-binding protein
MAYDRNDLVNLIQYRLNTSAGNEVLSAAQIMQVIDSFAELLPEILAEYGHCRVHKLGVFRLVEKKPRAFFNINTRGKGITGRHFKVEFDAAAAIQKKTGEIINTPVK